MGYNQQRLRVGASEAEISALGTDPLPELVASLERLGDIHARMDALPAKPRRIG